MNSDTPMNINDMQVDDVLQFVPESVDGLPSPKVRLNYVKMLYDVLGYELTPDVALASVSEPSAELVISTAGGGKTTWSQIKAIEQKCIRKVNGGKRLDGYKILCLVYNKHNVEDMRRKHARMVKRLKAARIKGLDIDEQINACTMHSFCEFFRKQFIAKLGLVGFTKADDDELISIMQRAVNLEAKVQKTSVLDDVSCEKLVQLYTLTKETLSTVEECQYSDVFVDLNLDVEMLTAVFARYEVLKANSHKFGFIDMLYSVYDLLSKDEEALHFVQSYYDYVIADEVQDFTPLMWKILQLFVSDGTPLTCIGDEDQNLYLFRGADVKYLLSFKDMFPGGKVYTLTENRRCREVILKEAKRVISENTLRFDKEIVGKKSGGSIECIPYSTPIGQCVKIVNKIKSLPVNEHNETVICYRNVESSMLAVDMLVEAGVSVNCLRACRPYGHELYRHVMDVFSALESPLDRGVYKNLWKVLPCKKSEFFEAIHYNPKTNTFSTPDDKIHFAEYNYGKLMRYNGFGEAIGALRAFSDDIQTAPLSSYFPCIMRMLNLYFWNYKQTLSDNDVINGIFEDRVFEKFNVDKTYAEVFRDIQHSRGLCASNTELGAGVTLSTFHSLKGLEFKNVFAVDMDNDVFPNFSLIEHKKYPASIEHGLKEAENRLWYVAVTRAIDTLTIFYNENNPSKYVNDYLGTSSVSRESSGIDVTEDDFVGGTSALSLDDFAMDDFAEDDFAMDDFAEDVQVPEELPATENVQGAKVVSFKDKTSLAEETNTVRVENQSTGESGYLSALFAQLV